jgi:hypothetical protein
LKCNGAPTEDRQQWAKEVSGFHGKLYKDDSISIARIDQDRRKQLLHLHQERLLHIRNSKSWKEQPCIELPLWLVLQARSQCTSKGKSSPSFDGISWRLIASMPVDVLDSVRKYVQNRLNANSTCCEVISDWSKVLVRLIPKLPQPTDVSRWRPIALSSCVQKLYCAILALLLEELSKPLNREACGFRSGHQVAEITEALRIGLEQ